MFVITKKQIIVVCCIILAIIGLPLCFYGSAKVSAQNIIATVVVDAGHGGIDGGVVGKTTKVKESDINLAISKYLKKELEKQNIKVVMTREDENGLYGNAVNNFKKKDMAARRDIILGAKPDLVISIHANKWRDSVRRGIQVFYDDTLKGEKAATIMQEVLNTHLNAADVNRTFSAQKGDYYITKCSEYVSIIIECGFLSNPDDERNLINTEYQKKLAQYITKGTMSYLNRDSRGMLIQT